MKKRFYILSVIFLLTLPAFFSGCGFFEYYYYLHLKNSTGETITVQIIEDSETRTAKKYGTQNETYTLSDEEIVLTGVVSESYYKILVNGKEIKPNGEKYTAEEYFFLYSDCYTIIEKDGDDFVFSQEDKVFVYCNTAE